MVTRQAESATWHAYPGNRSDVTQFPAMIKALRGQYEAITAAGSSPRT